MKGTSRLLIVGAVVLIMVALISLTYNFTLNITPKGAKSISLNAVSCDELVDGVRTFKFTIRNGGSETITSSEIAVFLDGSMMEENPPFSDIYPSDIDQEKSFTNKTSTQGKAGDDTIMVSSPGGDVSKIVRCP